MQRVWLFIFSLLMVTSAVAQQSSRFNILYGQLLAKYWRPAVMIHGIETTVFDYSAMQQEAGALIEEIMATLRKVNSSMLTNDNGAKAFWINVYNFAAMRLVVDAYPVDSITSFKISLIKHPWSKKSIQVGDNWYSLSQIEKEILLERYNDPRIIFAVSCAAVSCPDRTSEVFSGATIDAQLDELIQRFFTNPSKGLYLDRQTATLYLAWILKKDDHLFEKRDQGIMRFIMPYLDAEQQTWLQQNKVTIDFFEHDWTLNDVAQADPE